VKKNYLRLKITLIVITFFGIIIFIPFYTTQQQVDLNLKRTFGVAFGNYIQGTFTVVGSGSEDIDNLTLYFNGLEESFAEGNSISYKFKTKDYDPEELNITLIGYDSEGLKYSMSKIVKIMTPIVSILITLAIFILVIGAIAWKYGPRIKRYFQTKKDIRNNESKKD
jgi:hypothetical protein